MIKLMQKNSHKASILLWSIFISMIISVLFLSISTKITKTIKNNDNLLLQNKINEIIYKKIKNKDFTTQKISKNTYIIFEKNNPLIRILKNKQEKILLFNSGSTINLKIKKIYGADIYYKTYQGTNRNNINNLTSSGIISNNININLLDDTNKWGKIYLKNLGGESKIKIYSDNSCIPQKIHYKIVKIIGNTILTKTKDTIKLY